MELTTPSALANADFDQFNRYAALGLLLKPLLTELGRPCRILEVGCNVLDYLEELLEPHPVEVVRCDVERVSYADNFVLLSDHGPLPFADDAFDFVVALEVLEHVPPEERFRVLADWTRVASQALLLTCPLGNAEVASAERRANHAFHDRNGSPHPWLDEHQEFGLPKQTEVSEIFERLGLQAFCLHNSPLADWLPLLVLTEELHESVNLRLRQMFNRAINASAGPVFTAEAAYRQVWCAFKNPLLAKRARILWGHAPDASGIDLSIEPQTLLAGRRREVIDPSPDQKDSSAARARTVPAVMHPWERRAGELEVEAP